MNALENYASNLLSAQEAEMEKTCSQWIGRVENPIGVCDTLWIPTKTSNRSATVNLNHTIVGFDNNNVLWGENGNCCTPYVIIQLPECIFKPSLRNGEGVHRIDELKFLKKLGDLLIKKLNKSYCDPSPHLLVIKADDRLPVIIETIEEIAHEN
jgi:hypothetical protein